MTDVPINPVTRRVQFTGNTGTGPYAFTFNILQASDIAVFKNTATLTLTTDYTVAINANGTGAVTVVVALIASDLLTITGGRELSRTTDFVTGGPLLAGTLNEQLDSNVIMSQQLDEKFDRSLKIAQSDFTANLTLPIKSVRANQLLGFDASGNAVAGTGSTLNLTVANLTASSLTIPIGGSTVIEGFSFDSGKISTTSTNDPLELYSNGTGTVIASPSLTVDNLKLDANTFSSINTNGDINIFPNGSGKVNMDSELMVYGNDINGSASYVSISPSATGGDDLRIQGGNATVASYDTSSVSAQVPSMLGSFSLYGLDTSGNYIAYATLKGYAEDPFAGANGREGSLRIQISDGPNVTREHKFTATGLDVYNNITLSGTVDGRDIASDGSKLDGITANATTYSFSDTNGTVTVTPAQGSAATLVIGTAAGSGGLAMRGNAGGADSVALGTSSNAIGVNAITIGKSATTSFGTNSPSNGIAIGEQAHSYGSGTTALGRQASAIGDNSIALGSYASVPTSYYNSVALGTSATVNAANQIMLGTSNKTVKIPGALTVDGNITAGGTVDGRDIATDGTKLNTIETDADVTDATNVAAAGALMKSGGAMTGAITTNSTFDTRDVATDGTKLDTIETDADVTDATNVNAAGAVMVADTSTSGMGFVVDEDNMGSNSATKIPTQQSVKAYVDLNVSSSVQYRGSYNAATNSPNLDSSPSGITIGDMYTTTVAGTFYSTGLEIGDVLISEVANPSSVNDWTIVQQNLDAASIKVLYESNADTNAFDDAEQTRLAGIEAGAEVNIGQYFMISANSQGISNGEIITTHPNASGLTSEVIDFTGAGGLTVARAGNNLTFTSANTTYGFADTNGTVTITPSTGSAATLVIGTAAGSGGLAFRGNAGGGDSVALGTSSNAIGVNAIAIGKSATTSYGSNSPSNGIAIGEQAHSYGANTVALGRQASAEGASGIALGPYANVPSSYYNSTALGISATVTASNQIMLGTSGTAVKIPGTLDVTGNILASGTVDGIDIAARDAVLTSTTTTAGAALPKAGGTMTGNLVIESTDSGYSASALDLELYRNSSTPANNDYLSRISFNGEDSAGNKQNYVRITSQALNVTSGSEKANLQFQLIDTANSASFYTPLNLEPSATTITGQLFITAASIADTVTLTRSTNSQNNMIKFKTANITDWIVGERNDSTSDFRIYSGGSGANALSIARATNAATFAGAVTANAGVVVDNITIDANKIATNQAGGHNGDLTLDVAGDIILDADGGDIVFKDNGATFGQITNDSGQLIIYNTGSQMLKGNSGSNAKFMGNVDVTGTVTADGLTVDVTDKIDFGGGIGEYASSPAAGVVGFTSRGSVGLFTDSNNNGGLTGDAFVVYDGAEYGGTTKTLMKITKGNDLSLYEDTGTTPKFVWDASAESLGIGTSSPSTNIHIKTSTAGSITSGANRQGSVIRLEHDANYEAGYSGGDFLGGLEFYSGDSSGGEGVRTAIKATIDDPYNTHSLSFYTAPSNSLPIAERLRIDSSGNVGIGTSSPSAPLHVDAAGMGDIYSGLIQNSTTDTDHYNVVRFMQGASGSATGYIGTGGSATGNPAFRNNFVIGTQTSSPLAFTTNDTERMRIDASGNVGIGTSSPTGSLHTTVKDSNGSDVYVVAQNTTSNRLAGFKVLDESGTTSLKMQYDNGSNVASISNPNNGSLAIYLGGTSDAHKLDDYEEVNFTATIRGSTAEPATLVTVTGFATKIGRLVQYSIGFEIVNTTGYAGSVTFTGLPFANNGGRAIGNIVGYNGLTFAGTQSFSVIGQGATIIEAFTVSSAASWNNSTHNAGTTRYFWLTGTYMTTD